MAQHVAKIVQKEELVTVCDTCRSENPDFCDIDWYQTCKYDSCYDEMEQYNFCSLKCLEKGLYTVIQDFASDSFPKDRIKHDLHSDTYFRSFSVRFNNVRELPDFTKVVYRFLGIDKKHDKDLEELEA